jgi:hypothetical protein
MGAAPRVTRESHLAKPRPRPPGVTGGRILGSAAAGPRGSPTQTHRSRVRGPVTRPWALRRPRPGPQVTRPWDSASAAAAFATKNTRPPPKSRAAAAFPLEIFAAAGRPVVCPSRRLRGRVPKGPRRSACCLRVAAVFSGAARRGDYPALALARNEDLHRGPRPPPSQPPFKVQAAAKIINGRPEGRSNSPPSVGGP